MASMHQRHGFTLLRTVEIPELETTAHEYQHDQTGARLLSLVNQDTNKAFGIAFKTPPADSTGVPHIIEHSVLSGSRKYPVKEPFVYLMKGSLNTYLNAVTYPDKTVYPVASQNLQDFYNLIDVYLDAVFFPRLTKEAFLQEGWHYHQETANDSLQYRGVVFNEMKGAYSSPDRALWQAIQQSLFSDTPYRFDSGGDPAEIPQLTYEDFVAFHKNHYHPSNAYIFFAGNDDPEQRLKLVDEYLSKFSAKAIEAEIPLQPPLPEPTKLVTYFPADRSQNLEKKCQVTLNWLLPVENDPEEKMAIRILNYLLLGSPGAPLRKTLLESGLGEDLAGGGLETELRQWEFAVGLKGVAVADEEKVSACVLQELQRLHQEGFSKTALEAAFNTVEFRLRENNTGSFPRGLAYLFRALGEWIYDGDPLEPLQFAQPLAAVKAKVAGDPQYFSQLLDRFWLQNSHRSQVIVKPDPELRQKTEQIEQQQLTTYQEKLSDNDKQDIIQATHQLKQTQETPDPPEAIATLPSLALADLDREQKISPRQEFTRAGAPVLLHTLPTNGITYLDLGFNLNRVPQHLLPYLNLFSRALLEVGTSQENFVEFDERMRTHTGGLSTTIVATPVINSKKIEAYLFIRSKIIAGKELELFAIFSDLLNSVSFEDTNRLRQLILEERSDFDVDLTESGHRTVMHRIQARFDLAAWLDEEIEGLEQFYFLKELADEVDNRLPKVTAALQELAQLIFAKENLLVNVTTNTAGWDSAKAELESFVGSVQPGEAPRQTWQQTVPAANEALIGNTAVNYVGKGTDLYDLGYELHASSLVILKYIYSNWLWDQVRAKGGAYGAMVNFDRLSGVLSFASYRDPHLVETLDIYDRTADMLKELDLNAQELTWAIIGTIGDLDAYRPPDAEGFASLQRYLAQVTDEQRQQWRDQVLTAQPQHFRDFAQVLERVKEKGIISVLGNEETIEKVRGKLGEAVTLRIG